MTDASVEGEDPPKKKGMMMPLLIGVVLAAVGGGGGFFAVSSGLIAGGGETAEASDMSEAEMKKAVFVPLEPILVSFGRDGQRHLRFQAQLEVKPGYEDDVTNLLPRITDVLNGYLRAVDIEDVADPAALVQIRAQMLRRVQIVVGNDKITDLLVLEFVLN
ncbi:MAG: flagellar basal body-associated FliL family protein [Pseudomonadota bacterium]